MGAAAGRHLLARSRCLLLPPPLQVVLPPVPILQTSKGMSDVQC
jgi:hypothetical protein